VNPGKDINMIDKKTLISFSFIRFKKNKSKIQGYFNGKR